MPIGQGVGLRDPVPAVQRDTSEQSRLSAIRYQPHIDGLRALAVLAVIFHHIGNWAGLRGGYVGVDVFFVISGFLITSILKTELETGRFTFGSFYRRRITRLAPAYFTVLLVTTVVGVLLMLPAELMSYADSMMASSLFLANVHMWKEVGGYFGVNADTTPLLHLWSLAVEEQFYLAWPTVLLTCHRVFGRRTTTGLIVLTVAAGLIVSQWGVERFPAAAYYLLPTRFFELAVGASLAYLPSPSSTPASRSTFSMVGLCLVLYAAFAYGDETSFPGCAALAPVIGTAMLIRWSEGTPLGSLLSVSAMTAIGRISYPAYLWHWPIIAFLHLQDIQMNIFVGIGVVGATFLLSALTYRLIEVPARQFTSFPARTVLFAGAILPIAVSICVASGINLAKGFPSRFHETLNRKSDALAAFPSKLRGLCNEGPPSQPVSAENCILGRTNGGVDFLLVGDSHANHFTGFMDELAKHASLRGYDMTRSNTPFLADVTLQIPNEPRYNLDFSLRNTFIADHLRKNRYGAIVLGGAWADFYNRGIVHGGVNGEDRSGFERGMREALKLATGASDDVVVITSIPRLPDGLFDCPLRRERFALSLDCRSPAAKHRNEVAGVSAVFQRLSLEFPDVRWLQADRLLCDMDYCQTEMDGLPLYKDDGHLNDVGSRLLARKWLERYGNPLMQRAADDTTATH